MAVSPPCSCLPTLFLILCLHDRLSASAFASAPIRSITLYICIQKSTAVLVVPDYQWRRWFFSNKSPWKAWKLLVLQAWQREYIVSYCSIFFALAGSFALGKVHGSFWKKERKFFSRPKLINIKENHDRCYKKFRIIPGRKLIYSWWV
jgi:hypothetical protein